MSAAPHFRGKVCNGHIKLDDSVQIPEGTPVVVTVVEGGADSDWENARKAMLEGLDHGYTSSDGPLPREAIYERRR